MSSPLTSHVIAAEALSHQGVHHYIDGRFEQAISVFSLCLSMVKQGLTELDNKKQDTSLATDDVTPVCFFQHVQEPHSWPSSSSTGPNCMDGMPFIFKRPLFTLPQDATVHRVSHAYLLGLLFIQSFNLALSHHMTALVHHHQDGSEQSQFHLRKARDLYTSASCMPSTQMQLSMLEEMALVNNLGQVHAALNDNKLSHHWLEHLASVLMLLKQESNDHHMDEDDDMDEDEVEVEQFEYFMSSAMQVMGGHRDAMPAAAA